jgi:hypothetical protein
VPRISNPHLADNDEPDITYPLHPVCADYDDFTEAEAKAMRASLRKVGLLAPIVLWREQIVDGRHREKFCRELGIAIRYGDITDRCRSEKEMRRYVAALNEHRRSRTTPLTTEEKRAKVETALKADPERSDLAIADECGVSHTFVQKWRAKLGKGGGNVATSPANRVSKSGKKGGGQRKSRPVGKPEPQQPGAAPEATPELAAPEPEGAADFPDIPADLDRRDPHHEASIVDLGGKLVPVDASDVDQHAVVLLTELAAVAVKADAATVASRLRATLTSPHLSALLTFLDEIRNRLVATVH